MSRSHTRTLQTAAALLSLLGSCVKKSEYDALQVENQALQTRVDQASNMLVQSQTDVSLLQGQLQKFIAVQTQLQETRLELKQSQEEFKALKTQFDHFRTQRRSAMVGKKFPVLSLDDGKVLREAEITAVSAQDLSIRHADGLVKVALAKTTPDLRWQACYDPLEAPEKSRENVLVKAREMESRLAREQGIPPQTPAPAVAIPARNVVDLLRQQLFAQRQTLNTEYQALAAKNPAALRGVEWNSTQPEASPLLNTLSGSRAVLGISRLQSQRNAILATLQQLRELDPAAR
ncbi:MAG: hypothetical protein B7Z37_04505 [Verrucomicrobia bacterium 12-59-8]|nr:MAG: hypothetical protein B7Z37_04505 [Verrucomicrobia bacterium 12-59-8]